MVDEQTWLCQVGLIVEKRGRHGRVEKFTKKTWSCCKVEWKGFYHIDETWC